VHKFELATQTVLFALNDVLPAPRRHLREGVATVHEFFEKYPVPKNSESYVWISGHRDQVVQMVQRMGNCFLDATLLAVHYLIPFYCEKLVGDLVVQGRNLCRQLRDEWNPFMMASDNSRKLWNVFGMRLGLQIAGLKKLQSLIERTLSNVERIVHYPADFRCKIARLGACDLADEIDIFENLLDVFRKHDISTPLGEEAVAEYVSTDSSVSALRSYYEQDWEERQVTLSERFRVRVVVDCLMELESQPIVLERIGVIDPRKYIMKHFPRDKLYQWIFAQQGGSAADVFESFFVRGEDGVTSFPVAKKFPEITAETFQKHGVGIVTGFNVTAEFQEATDCYDATNPKEIDPWAGVAPLSIPTFLGGDTEERPSAGVTPTHAMVVHGIYVDGGERYFIIQNTWPKSQFIKASAKALSKHRGCVIFSPGPFYSQDSSLTVSDQILETVDVCEEIHEIWDGAEGR